MNGSIYDFTFVGRALGSDPSVVRSLLTNTAVPELQAGAAA